MKLNVNGELVNYEVKKTKNSEILITLNGKEYEFKLDQESQNGLSLSYKNKKIEVDYFNSDRFYVNLNSKAIELSKVVQNFSQGAEGESSGMITAPMPGKIFKILKKTGDSVKAGETVLILEAMKMEHEMKALKDGSISSISFSLGDQVSHGDTLVEIE